MKTIIAHLIPALTTMADLNAMLGSYTEKPVNYLQNQNTNQNTNRNTPRTRPANQNEKRKKRNKSKRKKGY